MIVLAIPYWECDLEKREILRKCVESFKDYDRLIVLSGKQESLPNAWNQLLRLSFGIGADYVVMSNDDVVLDKGCLADLCKPGVVQSPTVNRGVFKVFHAHIFGLPRDVYEKVGEFDERFEVYWSDTDYAKRMVDLGIPVVINPSVNVLHKEPGRTVKAYKGSTEWTDEQKFKEKWGRLWHDPVTNV